MYCIYFFKHCLGDRLKQSILKYLVNYKTKDENEFLLISVWLYVFRSCCDCDTLQQTDYSFIKMNLQMHHVSGPGLSIWLQQ